MSIFSKTYANLCKVARTVTCSSVLWRTSRSGKFSVLSNGDTKTRCFPKPPEVDGVSGVDGILDLAPRLERHGVRGLLEVVGLLFGGDGVEAFFVVTFGLRCELASLRSVTALPLYELPPPHSAPLGPLARLSPSPLGALLVRCAVLPYYDNSTRRRLSVVNRFSYRRLQHLLSPTRNYPRTKVRCARSTARSTPSFFSFDLTSITDLHSATATRLQFWCRYTTHARCHPAVTRSSEPLDRMEPNHLHFLKQKITNQDKVIGCGGSAGSERVPALLGFVAGFWCCREWYLGWRWGGIGAIPAWVDSKGTGHGWHCGSPRCEGVPTDDVSRRSRHFPPDALVLMELRFF
ncbi:hypothetical protein T07_8848 [Trichinella nelsoni]|uniref:Uncharacterized protein n=1 Tax=Trichinella nelsoni TaxID=6336 RepID=A0A0V0RLF5_9BILA|nr:hypothetical protein T07_8848 [Trichinella nelsoni]